MLSPTVQTQSLITLGVFTARTRITKPPQDQSVIKGTKAVMNCGVTHDPSVTIRYVGMCRNISFTPFKMYKSSLGISV